MKKTYYEILEIDKNASSEIVKKAYTTLAKKYHPDLQEGALKQEYEEKLKLINEAYEIISNDDKRKAYDEELKQEDLRKQANFNNSQTQAYNDETDYNVQKTYYSNNQASKNSSYSQSQNQTTQSAYSNVNSQNANNNAYQQQAHQSYNDYDAYYAEQIRQAQNKAYHDAYVQDLKNRGYKIRYKKTLKDYFKNFIALCLTALILFILWQIPFIRNLFKDNLLVQAIIKVVKGDG